MRIFDLKFDSRSKSFSYPLNDYVDVILNVTSNRQKGIIKVKLFEQEDAVNLSDAIYISKDIPDSCIGKYCESHF